MAANKDKTILSLCDFSGNWVSPYRDAGYNVVQVDLKLGDDIRLFNYPGKVYGILAAPPCTHFAVSGARWARCENSTEEDEILCEDCHNEIYPNSAILWPRSN